LNLGVALKDNNDDWSRLFNGNPPFGRGLAIALYGVAGGLGATGMVAGFKRTTACREAKAALLQREIDAPVVVPHRPPRPDAGVDAEVDTPAPDAAPDAPP
jgi:hypothetical protein